MKTLALPLVLACAACGSDADVNVEGNYSVATTNGENGCAIAGWNVGDQATNIPVTIRQEGSAVTAEVGGPAAIGLGLLVGSSVFEGTVDGSRLELEILGTNNFRTGDCNYTYDARLTATLTGDALVGGIDYVANAADHPSCASIASCVTSQDFNGTRPP